MILVREVQELVPFHRGVPLQIRPQLQTLGNRNAIVLVTVDHQHGDLDVTHEPMG